MTRATRLWPLLTGTQHYEKCVSTRSRGHGEFIEAPILAYLIETPNGRILYDTGCDYAKVSTPALREKYLLPLLPQFEPVVMTKEQRILNYLRRLGLGTSDDQLRGMISSLFHRRQSSSPAVPVRNGVAHGRFPAIRFFSMPGKKHRPPLFF